MNQHHGCLLHPDLSHPCRRETPALTVEELEEIAARERMRIRRVWIEEYAEERTSFKGDW